MLRFVAGCSRIKCLEIQCGILPYIYILFVLLQNITHKVTSATSKYLELINVVLLKQFSWDVEKVLEMVLESYWNKL